MRTSTVLYFGIFSISIRGGFFQLDLRKPNKNNQEGNTSPWKAKSPLSNLVNQAPASSTVITVNHRMHEITGHCIASQHIPSHHSTLHRITAHCIASQDIASHHRTAQHSKKMIIGKTTTHDDMCFYFTNFIAKDTTS